MHVPFETRKLSGASRRAAAERVSSASVVQEFSKIQTFPIIPIGEEEEGDGALLLLLLQILQWWWWWLLQQEEKGLGRRGLIAEEQLGREVVVVVVLFAKEQLPQQEYNTNEFARQTSRQYL